MFKSILTVSLLFHHVIVISIKGIPVQTLVIWRRACIVYQLLQNQFTNTNNFTDFCLSYLSKLLRQFPNFLYSGLQQ